MARWWVWSAQTCLSTALLISFCWPCPRDVEIPRTGTEPAPQQCQLQTLNPLHHQRTALLKLLKMSPTSVKRNAFYSLLRHLRKVIACSTPHAVLPQTSITYFLGKKKFWKRMLYCRTKRRVLTEHPRRWWTQGFKMPWNYKQTFSWERVHEFWTFENHCCRV